jgi:ABC-type phosphate/phosphonate transport system substrate-binding protein
MTRAKYRPRTVVWGLGAAILTVVTGCADSSLAPVRFATTRGSPDSMLLQGSLLEIFETAPFRVVQHGIGRSIGQRTQFMVLVPAQIHAHLASGYIQFAFVDEGDDEDVLADDVGVIIAKPVFAGPPPTCTGLFVVPEDSAMQSLSDLKGKRIAFGPPNHPALHWAALGALKAQGVTEEDLAKQLLPIPGSLQFHLNSLEAAKAALLKIEADAAVVDEAEFMRWPESGGNLLTSALSISISRDQLKVIGRTEPVAMFPSGPVVASHKADSALVAKVQDYLTQKLPQDRRITKPLGLVKYVIPQ